ncbi:hypothetical protein [Rothia koreensis]|uniref:hypothetical protein n=1 Tax=Rothia koreensis TaxID=592378 RepID=UPI003FCCB1CA
MRQAEKALREAGWEEIPRNGAHVGDEVYDLEEHEVFVVDAPASPSCNWTVLRAPRPESKYEHGTVARVKLTATGREFNAIWGPSNSWDAGFGYLVGDVEVLRVIAYPDGTVPPIRQIGTGFTRIEVIDETGRAYVNTDASDVEVSVQDDGWTLKVFTGGTGATPGVTDMRVEKALTAFRKSVDSDPIGKITDPDGVLGVAMRGALKAALEDGHQRDELIEGMVPRVARAALEAALKEDQ